KCVICAMMIVPANVALGHATRSIALTAEIFSGRPSSDGEGRQVRCPIMIWIGYTPRRITISPRDPLSA
ncbi:MAG: hypothetical protein M1162_05580, partial [Candidatus Thermoplasmatota archaeon]|nr:hypothetical protein [Candidatus Thermoplasmatota archaeon]